MSPAARLVYASSVLALLVDDLTRDDWDRYSGDGIKWDARRAQY